MFFKNLSTIIGAAFILVFSIIGNAHSQDTAQQIVERWINAADNFELITVNHDGIAHDSGNGVTTLTNLAIRFSGDAGMLFPSTAKQQDGAEKAETKFDYLISFPSISFTDLSQDGGYYSAALIEADTSNLDFSVTGTPGANSSAVGEYAGFRVENIRWAKQPEMSDDPNTPISKYFPIISALIDISFDRASVDSVSVVQDMGPLVGKATTSYGRFVVAKTERGNFSELSIDGMSMQFAKSEAENASIPFANFEIGSITASDYNYRTLIENYRPGNIGEAGNNPYQTFIGKMNMDGMKITSGFGNFNLGEMVVEGIGVRKPDVDLLGEIDRIYISSQSEGKIPDEKYAIELLAKFYGTMRIGAFEFANVDFESELFGKGKLGKYRFADFSADGLGEYSLEGLTFAGKNGEQINLDHFSLNDLKFPSLAALIGLEEAMRNKDTAAMLRAAPTLASIILKGLQVNIPGQGNIGVGESSTHMSGFIGPIPTNIDVVAKDIKIPVSIMDRDAKQVFSAMGFNEVDISARFKTAWDEASNSLSVIYDTQMKDAANVDFSAEVGGVPRSVFENPQNAQNALGTLTFNNARVNIEDRSIVDKGLAFAGAMQGVDAQTMKVQALSMLPVMLQALGNPAFVDKLTAAVKSFLDSGGSITAQASPAAPVLILQLMGAAAGSPGAIIDMLNVEVDAG